MQKNRIILILTLSMILSPVLVLQAAGVPATVPKASLQNSNSKSGMPPEIRAKFDLENAAVVKESAARKAEIEKKLVNTNTTKKNLDIAAKSKVITIIDKIFGTLNNQLGILSQVDIKVSTKIAMAEAAGLNVTEAKAQYAIAKADFIKTTSDVSASRLIAIDQTNNGTSKETLRALVKSTEDSIKTTGDEYQKLIPLVAKLVIVDKVENPIKPATTTK